MSQISSATMLVLRDDPLVGVHAVILCAEILDNLIDAVFVLNGLTGAEGDGEAINIKGALANGGFGEDDAGAVLTPVGTALDSAGITLHQNTMTGCGLDSSMMLVCSESLRGHIVRCAIIILPSRVAGPVATKALQRSVTGTSRAFSSRLRSK